MQDCFRLALNQSSTYAISAELINQTDAQIKQARAGYMPTLALQASTTEQDESTNPLAKSLSSTQQNSGNISLNQNLFQGFKDRSLISQRKNLKKSAEWGSRLAQQQIYKDVAAAFYSILIFQSDMALYQEQIESTRQRKSELVSAKKSGRARDSDLLTSDSSIASLEAAISRTKVALTSYQETLTYLTGLSSESKLIDHTSLPNPFQDLGHWLENFDQRADIQQAHSQLLAAEDGIKVAQSGFYPSLGLGANYYLYRPAGLFQGVDWDASLTLTIPIFSGGLTRSQVAEAGFIRHSNEILVRQNQELAMQSIRTWYAAVKADLDELRDLSKAWDLSRRSYDLVHRDNRLGVASNTDVLTALQVWQESKRNLERARITTNSDYVRLLIESSQITRLEAEK